MTYMLLETVDSVLKLRSKGTLCRRLRVTCEGMLSCLPSLYGPVAGHVTVGTQKSPHGSTCFALRNFSVPAKATFENMIYLAHSLERNVSCVASHFSKNSLLLLLE